jgi:sodium/proline symporter
MTPVIITFLICLAGFIAIGVASVVRSQTTTEDYLIASRNINPWLASLSTAATNTSGYMFIGLIGFTYSFGISSIWVTVGWITGDYIIWRVLYKRLRLESEKSGTGTVPSYIAEKDGKISRIIAVSTGIITLLLLAAYASAQLTAGGKALHVLFKWHYSTGAIIGACIVLAYCLAGGIRASIWTDVAQAIVMIVSMAFLLVSAMYAIGSPFKLIGLLEKIDPKLVELFPGNLKFGIPLYVAGWFMAGIGVSGQPHMVIRIMSMDSANNMNKARRAYFLWYIPFSLFSVLVGLYSRVVLTNVKTFDPELALPQLSLKLMPAVFVGLILAGLFAATMSTADSQVLSSGAALTQDIFPQAGNSRWKTKIGTLFIVSLALVIALFEKDNNNVFAAVTIAWSALGAGVGPLVIIRTFKQKLVPSIAVVMLICSVSTVLLWRYVFKFSSHIYEILPGFIVSIIIYLIYRFLTRNN